MFSSLGCRHVDQFSRGDLHNNRHVIVSEKDVMALPSSISLAEIFQRWGEAEIGDPFQIYYDSPLPGFYFSVNVDETEFRQNESNSLELVKVLSISLINNLNFHKVVWESIDLPKHYGSVVFPEQITSLGDVVSLKELRDSFGNAPIHWISQQPYVLYESPLSFFQYLVFIQRYENEFSDPMVVSIYLRDKDGNFSELVWGNRIDPRTGDIWESRSDFEEIPSRFW